METPFSNRSHGYSEDGAEASARTSGNTIVAGAESSSTPTEITREQQDALIERILASSGFRKSRRISDFLHYVCRCYQQGDLASIQEQRIGVEVFERREGYHVGEDSIVRSQARFLRQRLEEYFAREGASEPITLTIPKGSYVPHFQRRETTANHLADAAQKSISSASPAKGIAKYWIALAGIVMLAAAAACGAYFEYLHAAASGKYLTPPEKKFWNTVFDPGRNCVIVPSDSSLVMVEHMLGRDISLSEYTNRTYLEIDAPPGMDAPWKLARNSQYTNLADLNIVSHLERLPQMEHSKTVTRYARDLNLKELRESNAVLIGSLSANPWVELFANSYGFDIDYDWARHLNVVRNRFVKSGEQIIYVDDSKDPHGLAYGVISYLPSLDSNGAVLLIRGTNKSGTEAAGDFLFTKQFADVLERMDSAQGIRHFELLLSTEAVNGDSHHTRVMASHKLD